MTPVPTLRGREAQTDVRCAYCHDRGEGELRTCPDCRALLHVDCRHALGACPTLGCRSEARAVGLDSPAPLALAVLIGAGVGGVQSLLGASVETPSDLTALGVTAVVITTWLGLWWERWLPLLLYLCVGLALSAGVEEVWLTAGAVLVARRLRLGGEVRATVES